MTTLLPSGKPAWLDERPCHGCRTGYGECAQGLSMSVMCCSKCKHDPYDPHRDLLTAAHIAEHGERARS